MRVVVVVVVLALSSPAFAEVRKVPPPAQLVAKPLAVGQWASYREVVGGRDIGTIDLLAINRAECGMQFLAVLRGHDTARRWIFCVDDDHRLVKATLDGNLVVLHEHVGELGALLTRVLPPAFAGAFVREDVLVPAAYFEGAQRKDGKTTTWLHPDVPLGGVVRVKDGEREDVLAGYGDEPPDEDEVGRTRPVRRGHLIQFYELAAGVAYRPHTTTSDELTGASFTFGLRGSEQIDPIVSMSARDNRSRVASDTDETVVGQIVGGVRWHPFGRRIDHQAIGFPYLDVAAGLESDQASGMAGRGIAAVARVGWELTMTGDWAIAFQGGYVVDHTFGDVAGTHQLLDGTVAIRLQLP